MIKRIHFHTFDSLRFIAFLFVFLSHSPIPEHSFFKYFTGSGGIGVVFFFVLSGFLITYILLIEKLTKGKIDLKNFFRRRVLRIWPLYYAMLLFAFLTPNILSVLNLPSSNKGYEPDWLMSIFFLENYKMMITNDFPNVSPLIVMWTLCIEEHFYILWGVLLYFLPLKKLPNLIIYSIVISLISIIIYGKYGILTSDILTNISFFAFGAIPAFLFVFRHNLIIRLNQISKIYIQIYVLVVLAMILLISNTVLLFSEVINATILGILFAGLILCTLGEKSGFKISDKTWIAYLGKYTYGLYLIHPIIIGLFVKIGERLHWSWYAITIVSFLVTVSFAYLSYHLFEKRFLKLKGKAI